MDRLERNSKDSLNMSYAKSGAHFISGSTTQTGHFYGLTIVNAPTSINMTLPDSYEINGSAVATDEELVNYIPTNIFVPIHFNSITIDSGNVILWKY